MAEVKPRVSQTRPGNGFAEASLVLGMVGLLLGLIPIFYYFYFVWILMICGILAVVFGFAGWKRAKRGAFGKGMAIAGLILGVLTLALGTWGFVAVLTESGIDAELENMPTP